MLSVLTEGTPQEVIGLVSGCGTIIVGVVAAIVKMVNDKRRDRGHMRCCLTKRELKPRKKKKPKAE